MKEISSLKGRLGWQGLTAEQYTTRGPFVVSSAHFRNERINWEQCPSVTERRYQLDNNIQLSQGDVLLMKDGAALGKLAFVDQLPGPACLNSHLLLFRPRAGRYEPSYLFYHLASPRFQHYLKVHGVGVTFKGVSQASIGDYRFELPPLPEQQLIASILDTVDEVIRKTEEVIEKLQQMKQGLLHDLLTRGIDDNGELRDPDRHPEQFKDSELGRIPKDWEVEPAEHWHIDLIDGDRGSEYPSDNDFASEGHCLFLSAKNVTKQGFAFDTTVFISALKHSKLRKGTLKRGDIAVTTRGTTGNFAYYSEAVPFKVVRINSGMALIRNSDEEIETDFLYEYLRGPATSRQLEMNAYGSAQPQLNLDLLRRLILSIPRKNEQLRIVETVKTHSGRIRTELKELSKLRLLKSGLMDDLLTGRVRVTDLLESTTP